MAELWNQQASSGLLERAEPGGGQRARWSGQQPDMRPDTRNESRHAGSLPGTRLSRAVQTDVLPRLLLGHRLAPNEAPAVDIWHASLDQVVQLAACSIGEAGSAGDYVATIRADGVGVEAIYLDLLGPAARHLGEQWEDDRLSFADVTIGLVRLHQLLRNLAPDFRAEAALERPGRRALLVPSPGEQHSFGLAMVTEFFRRAGWSVWAGVPHSIDELLAMARGEWFGIVGFSVACDTQLESLAACIRRLRAVSRNPAIGVMVGGPIFVAHPELALAVGADSTAKDGRNAAFQAEGLLALQPGHR